MKRIAAGVNTRYKLGLSVLIEIDHGHGPIPDIRELPVTVYVMAKNAFPAIGHNQADPAGFGVLDLQIELRLIGGHGVLSSASGASAKQGEHYCRL